MAVKAIVTDEKLLKVKSEYTFDMRLPAQLIQDLLDTANANSGKCVGLAANQIGGNERVFVVKIGGEFWPIINPKYIFQSSSRIRELEACLSRPDKKPISVKRSKKIEITYLRALDGSEVKAKFEGFSARVIQHEMDHLDGILI